MTIADSITSLKAAYADLARATFPDMGEHAQFADPPDPTVELLPTLSGGSVAASPQIRGYFTEISGGANLFFGERWITPTEMEDPIRLAPDIVLAFDRLSSRESARRAFDDACREDVWIYLEAMGHDPKDGLPRGGSLVAFGYNLVELGRRPTFLYFEPERVEPYVWSSAVNPCERFDDLKTFLEYLLK